MQVVMQFHEGRPDARLQLLIEPLDDVLGSPPMLHVILGHAIAGILMADKVCGRPQEYGGVVPDLELAA